MNECVTLGSPHRASYERLLNGLQELIEAEFVNRVTARQVVLDAVRREARYPFDPEECVVRGDTYSEQVWVTLGEGGATWEFLLVELPRLSERDTLIVQGVERAPVAQLQFAPGIYFEGSETPSHDRKVTATLWPCRGTGISLRAEGEEGGPLRGLVTAGQRGPWALREFLRGVGLEDRAGSLLPGRPYFLGLLQQEVHASMPGRVARWLTKALDKSGRPIELSETGRDRINKRLGALASSLGLTLGSEPYLGRDDVLVTMAYLLELWGRKEGFAEEDVADLRNRRMVLLGEQLEEAMISGLRALAHEINENLLPEETIKVALHKACPRLQEGISEWVRGGLCQVLDMTNPLAEVSHKRKVTYRGPRGVRSKWGALKLRGMHASHYGRLCPLETPESDHIGLNLHLAAYAAVNDAGEITAPYVGPNGPCRLAPKDEDGLIIKAPEPSAPDGTVQARKDGEVHRVPLGGVTHTDRFAGQSLGLSASLIPFIQHNDLNRAMMGAKNLKQAVPLLHPEPPLVSTGMEGPVATLSGRTIRARAAGTVAGITERPLRWKTIREILVQHDGLEEPYPLQDLEATPSETCLFHQVRVQEGATVEAGQVLADGAGTLNGELALGVNLLVAYLPWRGYNFEDGIVISERCVRENLLTSRHVRRLRHEIRGNERVVGGETGIVAPGTEVKPGDLLFRKAQLRRQGPVEEVRVEEGVQGRVVHTLTVPISGGGYRGDDPRQVREVVLIWIERVLPLMVGDKLTGRHGNKGVVTRILPEEEMPHLEDGTPVDVLLNPHSVVSRMNLGQLFETHLGWAARALGCSFIAAPFQRIALRECRDDAVREDVLRILRESPTDEAAIFALLELANKHYSAVTLTQGKARIRDGRAGSFLEGPVTVGVQYLVKLNHLATDKLCAREEGEYAAVSDQPVKGRRRGGGQRLGEMEVWALEAHNVPALLQECLGSKSDDVGTRDHLWKKLGRSQDPGHLPESFRIAAMLLRGLGLRVDLLLQNRAEPVELSYPLNVREGSVERVRLAIATEKNIRRWGPGKIMIARLSTRRLEKAYACACQDGGGLAGKALAGKTCSRCRETVRLRGVDVHTETDLDGPLSEKYFGKKHATRRWKMAHIPLAAPVVNPVFVSALSRLVDEDLRPWVGWDKIKVGEQEVEWDAYENYPEQYPQSRPALSGADYVRSRLDEVLSDPASKERGHEWTSNPKDGILQLLPVIPPGLRPLAPGPEEEFVAGLNRLYRDVLRANQAVTSRLKLAPAHYNREVEVAKAKRWLQQTVTDLFKGIEKLVIGKEGIFRHGLLGKRVNYSGRAVIVPDPDLDLDACRLPKSTGQRILQSALGEWRGRSSSLEVLLRDRVVLLNRAPSLHRYNILAFFPKLMDGLTIGLHPLVCGGFNADFDGDTMAVHLPLQRESQREAVTRCLPSRHLRSIANGRLMLHLTQDIVSGAFLGTREQSGRDQFDGLLQPPGGTGGLMPPITRPLGKDALVQCLSEYLAHHGTEATLRAAQAVMRWAFEVATRSGLTLSLFDIPSILPEERDQVLQQILQNAGRSRDDLRTLTARQREAIGEAWVEAVQRLMEGRLQVELTRDPPSPLAVLVLSRARGDVGTATQLGGLRVVPGPGGKPLAEPVTASFRAGLSPLDFFQSGFGSRKTMVDKKIVVAPAGTLTRRLVEAAYPLMITEEGPCDDTQGIRLTAFPALGAKEKAIGVADRLVGRVPLEDVSQGGELLARAGEPLDAGSVARVAEALRTQGSRGLRVRSPFTCKGRTGLCQQCYGWDPSTRKVPEIGLPVGIIAGQSIGERGTQLTMRTFHTGGVKGEDITTGLPRVRRLVEGIVDLVLWRITDPGSSDLQAGGEVDEWRLLRAIEEAQAKGQSPPSYELLEDPPGRPKTLPPRRLTALAREQNLSPEDTLRLFVWLLHRLYKGDIDDRHYEVILRSIFMSEKGEFIGVTRAAAERDGFLSRAAFQRALDVLARAAIRQEEDTIAGYKERIMLGERFREEAE